MKKKIKAVMLNLSSHKFSFSLEIQKCKKDEFIIGLLYIYLNWGESVISSSFYVFFLCGFCIWMLLRFLAGLHPIHKSGLHFCMHN